MQVVRQQQIHQRLQNILGDMVARERGGEIVDKALLRSITQVGGTHEGVVSCRDGLTCGKLQLPEAAASQPHSLHIWRPQQHCACAAPLQLQQQLDSHHRQQWLAAMQ